MIYRCTQRVRDAVSLNDRDLGAGDPGDLVDLHEWYCHLFVINRRKCLLFTHGRTLYSFVVPGVTKADLSDFAGVFRNHLMRTLELEGYLPGEILLLVDAGPDVFGKTRNRSVVGSMNDLIYLCQHHVEYEGGFDRTNFVALNPRLNRTPMSALGMGNPAEKLKETIRSLRPL